MSVILISENRTPHIWKEHAPNVSDVFLMAIYASKNIHAGCRVLVFPLEKSHQLTTKKSHTAQSLFHVAFPVHTQRSFCLPLITNSNIPSPRHTKSQYKYLWSYPFHTLFKPLHWPANKTVFWTPGPSLPLGRSHQNWETTAYEGRICTAVRQQEYRDHFSSAIGGSLLKVTCIRV